jgi:hypothetical protein
VIAPKSRPPIFLRSFPRPPKFSLTLNSALTHFLPTTTHSTVSHSQILSSVPEVTLHTKVSPPLISHRQQGLSETLPPHFQTNTLLSFAPYPSIPSPSCWSRSEGIPFIFLIVRSITDATVLFIQARPPPQHCLLESNSSQVSFLF